jgi:hypothetical protein
MFLYVYLALRRLRFFVHATLGQVGLFVTLLLSVFTCFLPVQKNVACLMYA